MHYKTGLKLNLYECVAKFFSSTTCGYLLGVKKGMCGSSSGGVWLAIEPYTYTAFVELSDDPLGFLWITSHYFCKRKGRGK